MPSLLRLPDVLGTSYRVSVIGDGPVDLLAVWLRWTATLGTGESSNGVDFVEFAPDGRIARLTGFYEP